MPTGSVTPVAVTPPFNGGTITLPLVEDLGAVAGTLTADTEKIDSGSNRSISLNLLSQTNDQNEYVNAALVAALNPTTGLSRTGALTISTDQGGSINLHCDDTDTYLSVYHEGGQTSAALRVTGNVRTVPAAPGTQAFVSGAAAQISTAYDVRTFTPVTFNPGAATTATCVVAVGTTSAAATALWTETEPAGVAFDGTIHCIQVYLPAAWYLKLTVTNATIGTTTYY